MTLSTASLVLSCFHSIINVFCIFTDAVKQLIISEHLYQTRSSRVFYPDFRDKNADEKIEVDEDKVDSLDDSRDKNDDGNIDDKLEGFRL